MDEEKCGTCKAWIESKTPPNQPQPEIGSKRFGECHRGPPTPLPGGQQCRPLVAEDDWCYGHVE